MASLRTKVNYRKIYEDHYGPIPQDELGNSYHIHHIDGNCNNNDPSNLVALTAKDHYETHLNQGDWAAAKALTMIVDVDSDTRKELARKAALDRVANGSHNLLKRPDGTSQASDRVKAGKHHLLGRKNGSPHLRRRADGTSVQTDKVAAGSHHLLKRPDGSSIVGDRVKAGNHHWRKTGEESAAAKAIAAGTHSSSILATCLACRETHPKSTYSRYHGDKCGMLDINKRVEINSVYYSSIGAAAAKLGITHYKATLLNSNKI